MPSWLYSCSDFKSYFCLSLSFFGITFSGVHVSLQEKKKRKTRNLTKISQSTQNYGEIKTVLFTHRINEGDSKSFISKVKQFLFQYGLLDVLFHHLQGTVWKLITSPSGLTVTCWRRFYVKNSIQNRAKCTCLAEMVLALSSPSTTE